MGESKGCSACAWCFPLCCCVGEKVYIPLSVLSVGLILTGIGELDGLSQDGTIWTLWPEVEATVWILAILNLVSPITFLVSLFNCVDANMKRILVLLFFVALLLDALALGVLTIILVYVTVTFDAATDGDVNDVGTSILWMFTITVLLICLAHVNWAMATWYHYDNNIDKDAAPGDTAGTTNMV